MPLFAKLNDPQHWRTLPTVWFRRVVISDGVNEKPLRSVQLRPGLNIVWGQETPETENKPFQPGHGLGKTTFCRLLRFCLGEKSFGQPNMVAGVQAEFSDGYVEALVDVDGRSWCVRRHFSPGHPSFARRGNSLRTFQKRPPNSDDDPFSAFLADVRCITLADIPERGFLAGKKSFEWEHLLAVCTRDQEARYVDPLVWRSKRSTAELPAFLQPKADAIRCLLALLGTYADSDVELNDREEYLRNRVNQLKQRKGRSEDRLTYWEDHFRERLAEAGVTEADSRPMNEGDLFSLQSAYKHVHDARVAELARMDQSIKQIDMQLTLAAATLCERREHRESQETTAAVIRGPAEQMIEDFLNSSRQWQEKLRELRELKFTLCSLGNITYGKCVHVQEYAEQLEAGLASLPDEPPSTAQGQIALAERLEAITADIRRAEERAREALKRLMDEKHDADRERRRRERELEDLETAWNELTRVTRLRSDASQDRSLTNISQQLASASKELDQAKQERKQAVDAHRRQLRDFQAAFDVLVKRCITDEYEGTVKLTEDELDFQILHGETGSGEGFEMLAILLSDLALAILGAARKATHPGLVIHDSPREADLGPHAYRHYLSSIHTVLDSLACDAGTPLQYIVTTTTPPPKHLQTKAVTPLRLGGKQGMLF